MVFPSLGFVSLALGLISSPQSKEMDARAPSAIILPPPPFVDAKEEKGKLKIRFREIGLERVEKYNLYKLKDGKWRLMGSVRSPPFMLSVCEHEVTSYAIAAVDQSQTEGSRARFTSDYGCSKLDLEKGK